MAQKAYGGVNNVARNGIKLYGGVNGVARNIVKGYVGVNGVARQFWGNMARRRLKMIFDDTYEAGYTYNLTKTDCLTALEYALEEWLWLNQHRVHPDLAYYFEQYINRIKSDFLTHYNDEDEVQIYITCPSPSGHIDYRTVYLYMYLVNSDRTNANISQAGYNSWESNGSEAGYYRASTDLISLADFDQKLMVTISSAGSYTFNPTSTVNIAYNIIGLKINQRDNSPETRCITVYTSNLGVHFEEVEYPEDYWLEWDFSREGDAKYFDTQRGIYFGKVTNGIFEDGYLKLTEGWWEPPFWVYNVLGHCNLKFEFDGEITLGGTSEHRPIFKLANNYGLFFRTTGYWGFNDTAWLMSENDSPSIFYDGHVEFNLTFDNFLEVPRINFPNQSFEQINPRITFGGAATNQIAVWNIRRLRITKTLIDYSNIVYYRHDFYLSPDGIDIQYNQIRSNNYTDFVEYYGTNKSFHYNELNVQGNTDWTYDTRTLNSVSSMNIRGDISNSDNGLHRLYIPVNALTGKTKLKAVIGRQTGTGAANHRVGFGVAYVDDNNVLQTEGLTDLEVPTNRYSKFYFDITFSRIDYVYCEAKGAGTITHVKLLQFV